MEPLLIILGPTASGKTRLATHVAKALNGEIISADSRQIYRDMDIGTGKDLDEYVIDGKAIPYHLINIREAGEQYHVHDYQQDFAVAYQEISAAGHVPVVCGGTGFYIHAILTGNAFAKIPVDPKLREELGELTTEALLEKFKNTDTAYSALADTSTRKRLIRANEIAAYLSNSLNAAGFFKNPAPSYPYVAFGLNPEVETRRKRISARLHYRLQNGMLQEVQSLLDKGLIAEQLIYYGLEYKYITYFLTGRISFEEMHRTLETEIHRFAKRQMTFFRKMEKDGIRIHWLPEGLSLADQQEFVISRYRSFTERP